MVVGQLFVSKNMERIHGLDKKLGFNQWFPKGWSNYPGQLVMRFSLINGKMREDKKL